MSLKVVKNGDSIHANKAVACERLGQWRRDLLEAKVDSVVLADEYQGLVLPGSSISASGQADSKNLNYASERFAISPAARVQIAATNEQCRNPNDGTSIYLPNCETGIFGYTVVFEELRTEQSSSPGPDLDTDTSRMFMLDGVIDDDIDEAWETVISDLSNMDTPCDAENLSSHFISALFREVAFHNYGDFRVKAYGFKPET